MFPISRDPPEGGTGGDPSSFWDGMGGFQFLGIPPKGEPHYFVLGGFTAYRFQFLGIPPKGELLRLFKMYSMNWSFPISRDPPEGGTEWLRLEEARKREVSNF